MPHTRYIVVQHKDEWLIKFGDEEYGPYHSQAERCCSRSMLPRN
ncbi:MAG TPA: hypothetical protein VKD23_12490 [Terriglobales bacterium]|jgi:hypothetical protein|nr:hypothetical protein [Terriglobales bacterium]